MRQKPPHYSLRDKKVARQCGFFTFTRDAFGKSRHHAEDEGLMIDKIGGIFCDPIPSLKFLKNKDVREKDYQTD